MYIILDVSLNKGEHSYSQKICKAQLSQINLVFERIGTYQTSLPDRRMPREMLQCQLRHLKPEHLQMT